MHSKQPTRNLAMELADPIHFLAQLDGKHTHGKFLMLLVGQEAAQVHKLVPADLQALGIVCHVGPQQVLLGELRV